MKSDVITAIAGLADDDPRLPQIESVLSGCSESIAFEGRALTLSEAARRAGLSRPSLYRAIKAGVVHSFVPYPGANQRISEGELSRWMTGRN